jgi:hypothetical protein
LVSELIDADIVTPVPEDHVLVHEPSGAAFDSSTQLAVFRRGWTAGRDADVEEECAANARRLCVLRRPARYRDWRDPHLGTRRTGHSPDLCRLCDSDGAGSRRARSCRL